MHPQLAMPRTRNLGHIGWSGFASATAERSFQIAQGPPVVWIEGLRGCPPLLAGLRRAQTKILDSSRLAAYVTILVALAVCKAVLHMDRPADQIHLLEATCMSGWIVFLASSLAFSAIPFLWLLRLGSLLVGGTVIIHHHHNPIAVWTLCSEPVLRGIYIIE